VLQTDEKSAGPIGQRSRHADTTENSSLKLAVEGSAASASRAAYSFSSK
jgi:hypothetical protein